MNYKKRKRKKEMLRQQKIKNTKIINKLNKISKQKINWDILKIHASLGEYVLDEVQSTIYRKVDCISQLNKSFQSSQTLKTIKLIEKEASKLIGQKNTISYSESNKKELLDLIYKENLKINKEKRTNFLILDLRADSYKYISNNNYTGVDVSINFVMKNLDIVFLDDYKSELLLRRLNKEIALNSLKSLKEKDRVELFL